MKLLLLLLIPVSIIGLLIYPSLEKDSTNEEVTTHPTEVVSPAPKNTTTTGTILPVDIEGLNVHYIDVGQGDCTLIDLGSIEVVIDGGKYNSGAVSYLETSGLVEEPIEYLLATHPDADHIQGLTDILQAFEVEHVGHNGVAKDTLTYTDWWKAVVNEGCSHDVLRRGITLDFESFSLLVVHPFLTTSNYNADSISILLEHEDIVFLLTGDCETESELEMLGSGLLGEVVVLKAGHHGSRTASSWPFIDTLKPEVVVYSCGLGNTYGHPHEEAVENWNAVGASIYGTDVNGTVVVTTDGTNYKVTLAK